MDLHLKNKVVVVTGGASGLGKSISLMLAEEGAHVGVAYFAPIPACKDDADALVAEIESRGTKAVSLPVDVSDEASVAAMFDQLEATLGPADALVNNAAFCPTGSTAETTVDTFQKTVMTNLGGAFIASREVVRRTLPAERQAMIVNIASQAAFRGSQSGKTSYDASKMGIVGLTISLAREMAGKGINVNCVAPGLMYTDILAKVIDADPDKYNKRVPIGRIGKTEEIANMVVYLCSSRASYMTGATVDVSGGLAMH